MQQITEFDFVAGVLATLGSEAGVLNVEDPSFDRAMEAAYALLCERMEELDLQPTFTISTNEFDGHSTTVDKALAVAIDTRIISRVNPTFQRIRIDIRPRAAARFVNRLPGGSDLFNELADRFREARLELLVSR